MISICSRLGSSDHTPSLKPGVQHHYYADKICGEGYGHLIRELKKESGGPGKLCPATPSEAKGNEEDEVARVLPFGNYNGEGELVSEASDVLEVSRDYVEEEYTEARPLRRKI
uniref:Uncharacterized protein n=1 Tax=Cannabis sativa TaxID=3483 RepID=A0A803PBK5_CANSA